MKVAAIMPCRGRAEQTVRNVRRLLQTAGHDDWGLILVGGDETPIEPGTSRLLLPNATYWEALKYATAHTNARFLVNLANDLVPGQHWLKRALEAYRAAFATRTLEDDGVADGMIGFNGDSHTMDHSCHFLISRGLLDRYGGWPVWYRHNFGDTELCQRAIADGVYGKAPWAILFHDHWRYGAEYDQVYAAGDQSADDDHALFTERRRLGWPRVQD